MKPIRSAQDFVREQQRRWLRRLQGVDLRAGDVLSEEQAEAQARELAELIGYAGPEPSHFRAARSIEHALRQLAADIHQDIGAGLPEAVLATHRNSIVALWPTAWVDAGIHAFDYEGRRLDRYVISINHGLQFCAYRLAEAMLRQELGESTAIGVDGRDAFRAATRSRLSRATALSIGPIEPPLPEPDATRIEALAGAIATHVFWFVAWHELGHAHLGHAERSDLRLEDEVMADEFAVECAVRAASSHTMAWRNLAGPYLYLRWLEHVEAVSGRAACADHPSPATRARSLRDRLAALTREQESHGFDWIDARLPHWTASA